MDAKIQANPREWKNYLARGTTYLITAAYTADRSSYKQAAEDGVQMLNCLPDDTSLVIKGHAIMMAFLGYRGSGKDAEAQLMLRQFSEKNPLLPLGRYVNGEITEEELARLRGNDPYTVSVMYYYKAIYELDRGRTDLARKDLSMCTAKPYEKAAAMLLEGSRIKKAPRLAKESKATPVPLVPQSNAPAATASSSHSKPSATASTSAGTTAGAGTPAGASSVPGASSSTSPAAPVTAPSKPATAVKDTPVKDKWAVIIGISKFANPTYNLKYAARDAEDFKNYLVNEANFKADHVLMLTNEQATRGNIMRAFGSKWLPSLAEPGDLVVIYISTHGTPSNKDNGGRNYIVAYDTDANDLYASAVDMDELSRRIKEGVRTDRALIVLDTCYSGGGVDGARAIDGADNFDVTKFAMGSGHLIISSSSPSQRSYESKNYQNGVFTRKLIDSLRVQQQNDLANAFARLKKDVSWEVKRDYGCEQTPLMGGTWQGKQLILSAPPTEPRDMVPAKLQEMQGSAP